jgi:N4-gp56 family major capsid protein
MDTTKYTDITPRINAYRDVVFLERAQYNNNMGMFGMNKILPKKNSQTMISRRYNKLDNTPNILQEGVTPTGKKLTYSDVQVVIKQYGDWLELTDVIEDTHEDPVQKESVQILAEQAAEMIDLSRGGVLKAGTNVLYSNGTARNQVNTVIDADQIRKIVRVLKAQQARMLTQAIMAGPKINTFPIPPTFVAVCHSDIEPDLERISTFRRPIEYAQNIKPFPMEIGAIGSIRFVQNNLSLSPWADAGGTYNGAGYATLSTTGANSDVYPILIFGRNAYATVALGGKTGVSTYVVNPGVATKDDPLAQRGTVGWKTWNGTYITNEVWMLRFECAAKG